ncbi:family 43 glycosylhydrolase [Spirochaeta dissipatitropha]
MNHGVTYGWGYDGQRKADLGDGRYLNPVVPGDHPDPTVLKDGSDYYMTFSSFLSYPGIVIWHSRDLVNWRPICTALTQFIGSVYALDLIKHENRYYIYIPAVGDGGCRIFVIYADRITGPWSEPVDLKIEGHIDPGHAVGEDGKRYLFLNGINRIGLADDGLSTIGDLEQVYEPWRYPEDWVVEMFAPEGPKITRHGDYFYLISAVGGTAGPPTSHMVIAARSKSIHGPWEDCPHNPLVRTVSKDEPWWSRGHATLVEGPAGDWWMVYHAYENGFRTLGRQTILEAIEWTDDGWFRALGGTLEEPMRKPVELGVADESAAGFPLSDDFSTNRMGMQWSFYQPDAGELIRADYTDGGLLLKGKGTGPADCSPLTCIVGDRSWAAEVQLDVRDSGQGGLLLFYDERMFCGVGFSSSIMFSYHYGQEHPWMRESISADSIRIRVENREHIVTWFYALDEGPWVKHPWQMEVSGFNHNVFAGFTSLKCGLFSTGPGSVCFRKFQYRAL